MSLFVLLAQATTLPPPPAPKPANSVSPLSIVLVVVIVLGSVAMIALASRRFRRRPPVVAEESESTAVPVIDSMVEEPAGLEPEEVDAPIVDPNLLARLRRVTGHQAAERRKLGNRKSPADHAAHGGMTSPAAPLDAPAMAEDGTIPGMEPTMELYPEPIPIRRRTSQRWQDEPVIAPGPLSGGPVRARASVKGAALQGLTSEEVSQLEAPRQTARAPQPLPRLKPDAALAKAALRPTPDEALIAELSATVRELLYCANVGELLHGFTLYSDPFLFRTMDDTGLSEDDFRRAFEDAATKPVGEWTRLASLVDLERLTPELVEATIAYLSPANAPQTPPERFRFIRSVESQSWLIDDIRPLDE